MGWLRELMLERHSVIRSYGELARAALSNPIWQEESKPQPRSLAALLSKFDRGLELDWLADRQSVQYAIAAALQCPIGDVTSALQRQLRTTDSRARRFRLHDVRYARPLLLEEEALPPGIPPVISEPALWGSLWWRAGTGSGRSLAGKWLAARGLASYIEAERWEDVAQKLPARGPIFVDIRNPPTLPILPLPGRQLCVAGPFPGAIEDPGAKADRLDWHVIESESPLLWLDDLIDWLAPRLPQDGHFEADFARDWLKAAVESKLLDSLDTALGLLGLLDELGAKELRGKDFGSLARRLVRARFQACLQQDESGLGWLVSEGFELLVALVRAGLTDAEDPLVRTRSQHSWIELVPREFRRSIDANWLRVSLGQRAVQTTVRDVERALVELPPGAFQLIQTLAEADLLRRVDSEAAEPCYTLGPSWLFSQVLTQALDDLCRATPAEWGEALLRPKGAARVLEAIVANLEQGDSNIIEQVLDLETVETPAEVLAFECSFRAVGVLLMLGKDLPLDHLQELWKGQLGLAVCLPGFAPQPLFRPPQGLAGSAPLLELGSWYLAAWAIAERLPAAPNVTLALCPWSGGDAKSEPQRLELTRALDQVESALGSWPRAWLGGAFSLLARLEERLSSRFKIQHRLLAPNRVVGAAVRNQLVWPRVRELEASPLGIAALQQLAEAPGPGWPRIAQAIWYAWFHAGMPTDQAEFLTPAAGDARAFWPELPVQVLYRLLVGKRVSPSDLPAAHLKDEHWRLLMEHWSSLRADARRPEQPWTELPARLIGEVLSRLVLDASAIGVLQTFWKAAPQAMLSRLVELLEQHELTQTKLLLESCPHERTADAVGLLRQHLLQPTARPEQQVLGIAWLHDRVGERSSAWRDAYALLGELSVRWSRSHRISRQPPSRN